MANLRWIFLKSVNHITSEQECLWGRAWTRVKAFVDVIMALIKVISEISWWQNFAIIRKNVSGTMAAFAQCCYKFRELRILRSNGQVVIVLFSQSRGPRLKTTRWLQSRVSLSSFQSWSNEYQELLGT